MKKFYSVKEIAEIVGVTPQSVHNWILEGKIKAIKLTSRIIRISESELNQFINKGDIS